MKIHWVFFLTDEETLDDSESNESDLKMANKTVTPLDLVGIMGMKQKEGISDNIAATLIVKTNAIKGIGPSPKASEKQKKMKTDRGEVRLANKQLLGKLHTDHQYLKSLLQNPLLTKKYRGTEGLNTIPKKVPSTLLFQTFIFGPKIQLLEKLKK